MPEEIGVKKTDQKITKISKPSLDAINNQQVDGQQQLTLCQQPLINETNEEEGPINLISGSIVAKKYQIIEKLGEGGCGSVYVVKDNITNIKYAMKSESLKVGEFSVLKLEVQVMKRLGNGSNVCQLIASGKNDKYSYMIMSLLGNSLFDLLSQYREFTVSTSARAAIQALTGLKQLHDVGFIHRDIKTENLAIGKDNEKRIVFLLDFGLVREYFFVDSKGKLEIRKAREKCHFRGTLKYASISAQEGNEQGRKDDLWGLLYCVGEFFRRLPWDIDESDKSIVKKIKKETPLPLLFKEMPEMVNLGGYLDTLTYYSRPDYKKIYSYFKIEMDKVNASFDDPYDWELDCRYVQEQLAAAIAKRNKTKDNDELGNLNNNKTNKNSIDKKLGNKKGGTSKNCGTRRRFYKPKDVIMQISNKLKKSRRKRNLFSDDKQIINDENIIATAKSTIENLDEEFNNENEKQKKNKDPTNYYEIELGKNDIGL
ncbi:Asator [Strongyloides ratti]|uniref:Asator n=1 Tax=Strongyloides ratti TaxID=34506 RepID=A0A090L8E6_STRRB|nr:Asator [Strongyloides ratti]CEF64403.1 Asator [Strongyloides ratti]